MDLSGRIELFVTIFHANAAVACLPVQLFTAREHACDCRPAQLPPIKTCNWAPEAYMCAVFENLESVRA